MSVKTRPVKLYNLLAIGLLPIMLVACDRGDSEAIKRAEQAEAKAQEALELLKQVQSEKQAEEQAKAQAAADAAAKAEAVAQAKVELQAELRAQTKQFISREKSFTSRRVKSKALSYNDTTDTWVVDATPGFDIDPDTAQFEVVLQSGDKGCSSKRSSSKWIARTAEKLTVQTVTATTRRADRSCRSTTTIRYKESKQ